MSAVEHDSPSGENGGRARDEAPVVLANTAPHNLVPLLPEPAARRVADRYAGRPLSLSLLSIALGFDRRPSEFGVRSYSNWISRSGCARWASCAGASTCSGPRRPSGHPTSSSSITA